MLWGDDQPPPLRPAREPEPTQHLPERGHGLRLAVDLTPRRMRVRRGRITYLPIGSEAIREDELLARAWGCKPSSAHQRKLRVAHEAADVIRTKREAGATESLAGWLRPIEEALAHQSPDGNHELTASLADCAEDSAESIYRADPTEANARLLLRKRAMERQTSLDHDRTIAARWGITP